MKVLERAGLADRPTPALPPGGALLRVGEVGICGTDYQLLSGERPGEAAVLGHEGWATVVASDAAPGGPVVGQRVVFNPVDPAAPQSVLGHSYDGLLQETVAVGRAGLAAGVVVPAAEGVPDAALPLVEPLATVVYGFDILDALRTAGRLLVVGCGFQGLLRYRYAERRGWRVKLVTARARRRDWLVAQGIVAADDILPVDDIATWADVDAVALCVHRRQSRIALDRTWGLLADDGVVELVSAVEGDTGLNAARAGNECGSREPRGEPIRSPAGRRAVVTGHRGTARRHLDAAMAELRRAPERYLSLVTHRFGLAEAARFLGAAAGAAPRVDLIKAVVAVG